VLEGNTVIFGAERPRCQSSPRVPLSLPDHGDWQGLTGDVLTGRRAFLTTRLTAAGLLMVIVTLVLGA
jgi:hypothetical protein